MQTVVSLVSSGLGAAVVPASVANLGRRPTIGKLQENFEVHLFDFVGDLYGQTLRVALVDFIRPEMKFSGLEQLKAQIAADGEAGALVPAWTRGA